jgi:hypothetical protein
VLKQITEWNTVKKIWMIGEADLFSQQYKPYSDRWPISGMMRNGVVYELPMQELHTIGLESSSSHTQVLGTPTTATSGRSREFRKGSNPNPVEFVEDLIAEGLLRTPSVVDSTGGAISETQAKERGRMVKVSDQVAELAFDNGLQVSESITNSLLPTPVTTDGKPVDVANQVLTRNSLTLQSITAILDMPEDTWEKTDLSRNKARQVGESAKRREEAASLLPTPAVGHIRNHDEPIENYLQRRQDFIEGRTKGMPGASLGVAVRMEMMPTPAARDYRDGTKPHERDGVVQTDTVARAVFNSGEISLLGTPRATPWEATDKQVEQDAPKARIEDQVLIRSWGKFEPAIRRWERLTRPAPSPTKPDGKDGNHRLSAEFTEWMMGLPAGWVTDHELGLKRNDQLKACGNGVVPQQAELALSILLDEEILKQIRK